VRMPWHPGTLFEQTTIPFSFRRPDPVSARDRPVTACHTAGDLVYTTYSEPVMDQKTRQAPGERRGTRGLEENIPAVRLVSTLVWFDGTASDRIPNDNEYAEFRVWPMRVLGRRDGPEQEIVQACGKALGTRGGIQDLNESFRPLVPLYCRSRPEADPLAQIPGDRQLVLSFGS